MSVYPQWYDYRAKPGDPWVVTLYCCGRESGTESFQFWEEADQFRESYARESGGHERVGVISCGAKPREGA